MKKETTFNKQTRLTIKLRDKNRCIFCGSFYNIQIHHIIYSKHLGLGVEQNGVCLCNECHAKVHSNKNKYQPILKSYIESKYDNVDWNLLKYKKGVKI